MNTEKSAARQFWEEQMEKRPTLHGILSILGSLIEFFIGGHVIVRLGHKIALTGGVIAETSLLFATLWVTADYTVRGFLQTFMSPGLMSTCSSLSQAAFSLLPEIILASAVVTTIGHWKRASVNWQGKHWIWASLFTAPTLTFLVLTLYTISTFSSQDGSIAQATGAALALRCFAGYSYALLELIYARIGTPTEHIVSQREHLKTVEELHAEHEERMAMLASQHQQALAELTEQHERRLGQCEIQQQQRLLTAIQEVQGSVPAIDYEALTETVTKNFEARFEAAMRQHITSAEATPEATNLPQREAKNPASRGDEAPSNILPLKQARTAISGVKAEVYRLVEQGLSSYQIAPRVGKSPATIQRWIKDRPDGQQEREAEASATDEAADEATDTAL